MTTKTETATIYIRCLPRALRQRFKIRCAERGISMWDGVIELMRSALASPGDEWPSYPGPYFHENNCGLNVRNIPVDLRDEFVKQCPSMSMERVLVALIRDAVR